MRTSTFVFITIVLWIGAFTVLSPYERFILVIPASLFSLVLLFKLLRGIGRALGEQ